MNEVDRGLDYAGEKRRKCESTEANAHATSSPSG